MENEIPSAYERAAAKIEIATLNNGSNAAYEAEVMERNKTADDELAAMEAALAAGQPLPSEIPAPVQVVMPVPVKAPIPVQVVVPTTNAPKIKRMDFVEFYADAPVDSPE